MDVLYTLISRIAFGPAPKTVRHSSLVDMIIVKCGCLMQSARAWLHNSAHQRQHGERGLFAEATQVDRRYASFGGDHDGEPCTRP